MLTIFAIPKPFSGEFDRIQRNAISSWKSLPGAPQIILFGDEEGTSAVARQFDVHHVPEMARNEFGAPLMSDVFARAQRIARHDLLCFVNADIILTADFIRAIRLLREKWSRFLMFCTPWNLRLDEELDFTRTDWEARLREAVKSRGRSPRPVGVDAFVFPRGFYDLVPPFAIGRTTHDNWLLYRASQASVPAVDATPDVLSVHQDHAGTTHGRDAAVNEQIRRNQRMAGWWARSFVAADLPYELMKNGELRKKGIGERLRPRVRAILSSPPVIGFLERTYKLRRRIGLHRASRSQPVA